MVRLWIRLDWEGLELPRFGKSSKRLQFLPGVPEVLAKLSPLLRPFLTRWWAEKAARLNSDAEKESIDRFEAFLSDETESQ